MSMTSAAVGILPPCMLLVMKLFARGASRTLLGFWFSIEPPVAIVCLVITECCAAPGRYDAVVARF